MFLMPGESRAIISASDLRQAASCEWGLLVGFDAVLGRRQAQEVETDALFERTLALGMAHEQQVLRELSRERRVVQIARPRLTRPGLAAAAADTVEALEGEADVVYQAAFAGERFVGFADFLVRGDDGRWQVWDTKLARAASVAALLQLAAYGDQLWAMGVPVADDVVLALGSGERERYPLSVIAPVYAGRRERVLMLLDTHQDSGEPAQWGEPGVHACGRCPACTAELRATNDVLLVAGVYPSQRKKLLAAGVTTMADLAARDEPVPDLPDGRLARIRAQARLQLAQEATGEVRAELIDPAALAAIPPPSPGDIFFDFEGDPMWTEPGSGRWGLEYLFGIVETPASPGLAPPFRAFWAHDRAQERQALIDFLAYVAARRAEYPNLHIYHYADYERSRLLTLAARYGTGEAEVDQLLRDGVLVDLYAVVRAGVRVSQDSYSIKKLEPLYMGGDLRVGSVATGGESVVAYHEFVQAGIEGRHDEAAQRLEAIRAYNEYDCLSTLRLRDWLLGQAEAEGVLPSIGSTPEPPAPSSEAVPKPSRWERAEALEARLRALTDTISDIERTDDEQALALIAAAVQFNRREEKPHWWRHFDRLRHPVDEWAGQAEVLHITAAEVVNGWEVPAGRRTFARTLRLTGHPGRGSRPIRPGAGFGVLYDVPPPQPLAGAAAPGARVVETKVTIAEVSEDTDGLITLVAIEGLPQKYSPFDDLPLALTPEAPPGTSNLDAAIADIAESVADTWPHLPPGPALDILRRRPPRLSAASSAPGPDDRSATAGLPAAGPGDRSAPGGPPATEVGTLPAPDGTPYQFVRAIRTAIERVDNSYLAVQGPPGTGKTYVAAHVIADLVSTRQWAIGVVAQSHAAVENVLDALVKAGLDPDLIGKFAPDRPASAWHRFERRDADTVAFAADRAESGYVIGGTAYDFTNPKRFARGQLDLLVVDEAGQYSLANTLACSVVADRLLLLGDPQQLAEVSQGIHPEPIDTSALGWLMAGQETIDPRFGYFLSTTWRMHPALAERVSHLSYAGSLTAEPSVTTARRLAGLAPGVHVEHVEHDGNTVDSPEEAGAIARSIHDLIGREWLDPDEAEAPRPLRQSDIRVVTPYNAQVHRLRAVLDAAGLTQVAAGTVDKFQGQEGAVVYVSMAASARTDVSRGMGFLLQRNRLNVALSRAKWAAIVVCSPELTDFTPASPRELLLLGAFLQLTAQAPSAGELLTEPKIRQPTLF